MYQIGLDPAPICSLFALIMPLHPHSYGFRFDVRVEHLTPDSVVEFICARCGKRHMVATYMLYLRFTPQTKLNIIADRFRCRGDCTGIGKARWSVYRAETLLQNVSDRT